MDHHHRLVTNNDTELGTVVDQQEGHKSGMNRIKVILGSVLVLNVVLIVVVVSMIMISTNGSTMVKSMDQQKYSLMNQIKSSNDSNSSDH